MTGQQEPQSVLIAEEQAERDRRRRLLDIMAGSGAVVCVAFFLLMLLPIIPAAKIYFFVFGLLLVGCLLAIVLSRMGYFAAGSLLFLLGLSVSILTVIVGGIFDAQVVGFVIYYFPLTVLAAGMLLGPRATFALATLNTVFIVLITVIAYLVLPNMNQRFGEEVLGVVIPAAFLCYLMALVAWLYGSSLEGALAQLTQRSRDLEAANQEIRAFSRTLEDKVEERTRELREFVSMVAHDLRNPLAVIRGYTEFFQEQPPGNMSEKQHRALDLIAANAQHMMVLTDDLLELSRLQSGTTDFDMESLPIQIVVEEVCTSFERQIAEKRLQLELDLPPDLPLVRGDHHQLTRVISNLVGNAYNYTPSGGIVVGARPVNGGVEVRVSDTGIGIPPEEKPLLFTNFYRGGHEVVRHTRGTGLGLSISRHIVEAHGGQIQVQSEAGAGTTVCFTVPVAGSQPLHA